MALGLIFFQFFSLFFPFFFFIFVFSRGSSSISILQSTILHPPPFSFYSVFLSFLPSMEGTIFPW